MNINRLLETFQSKLETNYGLGDFVRKVDASDHCHALIYSANETDSILRVLVDHSMTPVLRLDFYNGPNDVLLIVHFLSKRPSGIGWHRHKAFRGQESISEWIKDYSNRHFNPSSK